MMPSNSTGLATLDVAVGSVIIRLARLKRIGRSLVLFNDVS